MNEISELEALCNSEVWTNVKYLGDSVYIAKSIDGIVLFTFNGYAASNIIYLDSEEVHSLKQYVEDK